MREIPTDAEVDVFGTQLMTEGEQGVRRSVGGQWSLPMFVFHWHGWVSSLELGGLLLRVEWESACDIRDDLDQLIARIGDSEDFMKVVMFVDRIDQRFRAVTVASARAIGHGGEEWWWYRVPRRTEQRLFLLDRWRPGVGPSAATLHLEGERPEKDDGGP